MVLAKNTIPTPYHPLDLLKSIPQRMKSLGIPGLSLAWIDGDQITPFEFGVKNNFSQEPVTSTTVFEGASLSKPVIAYAALKLCRKGLLDLDRPLIAYLPKDKSNDLNLAAVTLRHILSHTAGFPTANLKPGEVLKFNFQPGSQFAYSGESYRYLGQIIALITRTPLARYMRENVFTPLKMEKSSFIWEEKYSVLAASPHNQKGEVKEKWKPQQAIASFSLHTTAPDFAKFMIATRKLPEMSEPAVKISKTLSWGLGWGLEIDSHGTKGFWHSGDNGTFQCFAFHHQKRGLIIMTNSPNGMKIYREIVAFLIGGTHPLFDWEQFETRAAKESDEELLSNWWKIYGV